MRYFTQDGSRLIWRNNGETLIISPWGPDSMRVQSVLMGEIRDDRWALLDQQPTEAVLDIRDESASMAYEFPEDEACAGLKDQYMFGSRYLVAPVLYAGLRRRDVMLPAGCSWRNVDTGETYAGGRKVPLPAPLDRIPVLERI